MAYKCKQCNTVFGTESEIDYHIPKAHPEFGDASGRYFKQRVKYKCPCGQTFETAHECATHHASCSWSKGTAGSCTEVNY